MTRPRTRPDPPAAVPYIFVIRPRCPYCGGVKLTAYRTTSQGDGSILRYVVCRICYCRIKLILE